jgi:hypothetical protein
MYVFQVQFVGLLSTVPWGRLHNKDIYRMKIKRNTNVSTFIYYAQALHYMFRPFLGHHQASHKNIKLTSRIVTLIRIHILLFGFVFG